MTQRVTEYFIRVLGAQKDGHPVGRIEFNQHAAMLAMDQLHAEFPQYDVILYELVEREVAKFKGKMPPAKCPRGCDGTRDGRQIVIRTHNGMIQCSLCGYLGA